MRIVKQHLSKAFAIILCVLLFTQCAEVIDLNNETSGGQLIIAGRLTNGTMGNIVNITRALPDEQAPEPISGALVKVIAENGAEEEFLESSPGNYELGQGIVLGQVGGAYFLEVKLDGKTYTSSAQEMMPILAQDELRFELGTQEVVSASGVSRTEEVIKVYANSTLNSLPDEFYIRWAMEEVYNRNGIDLPVNNFPFYEKMRCYITNELSTQEIFLVDGTEIRNVNLNNREMAVRGIDNSFITKHYFNIIQFALNKEAHDYWKNLLSITARQGSIFDSPPAPIPGNIFSSDPLEDVFGFFEASAIDTTRLLVTNNDIPIFFLDPCPIDGADAFRMRRLPFQCISCLFEQEIVEEECVFCNLLPNSTTVRPSYF